MISFKFLTNRLWLFSTFIIIGSFISSTFINMFAALIVFWEIIFIVSERFGFKQMEKWPTLMILVFLLNDLIVQIPLAALTAVMITVSIATFDWDALKRLHKMPKSDALVIVLVVVVVATTNNLAYDVILGLALTAIFFAYKISGLDVQAKEQNPHLHRTRSTLFRLHRNFH